MNLYPICSKCGGEIETEHVCAVEAEDGGGVFEPVCSGCLQAMTPPEGQWVANLVLRYCEGEDYRVLMREFFQQLFAGTTRTVH